MIKNFHLVSLIEPTAEGYTLRCRCSIDQYEQLAAIICERAEQKECPVSMLQQDNEVVEYQVLLPRLAGERRRFYILLKDGEKRAVWKPDTELDPASLPPGFFFQGIHLNLVYEEGKSISEASQNLNNYYVGFTGIWRNKSELFFSGYIFLPAGHCYINRVRLKIIKFREEEVQSSHRVSVTPAEENIFGLYHPKMYSKFGGGVVCKIVCIVDMETIKSGYGYFNLFVEHCGILVTPSNYSKNLSAVDHCFPVRSSPLKRVLFVPFYNEFANKWRLDIYHLSLFEWVKLKRLKKRCSKKPVEKDNKIWLVGEYNSTARDNGMHFYNYLCRKKNGITAYYVIYRNSTQQRNLLGKNVIYYGTYKHFKIAARAGVLVFSHMPEFLLPKSDLIVQYKNRMSKFKTVFIQHGVIAMKSNIMFYAKAIRRFNRFVVSSDFEKDIVRRYFRYDEENIVVTGLPRWDALYGRKCTGKDILLAPTWRDELEQVDDKTFMQSAFFHFWSGILTNEPLLAFLKKHSVTIRFLLHIGMHRFSHLFAESDVVIIEDGSRIGDLIRDSPMMVTDYSSIAFDMLFMERPVIFCPYDRIGAEVERSQQFVDFEKDIPGPVCLSPDAAVHEIFSHVHSDFVMNKRYSEIAKKYFKHKDANNCDRLYTELVTLLEL